MFFLQVSFDEIPFQAHLSVADIHIGIRERAARIGTPGAGICDGVRLVDERAVSVSENQPGCRVEPIEPVSSAGGAELVKAIRVLSLMGIFQHVPDLRISEAEIERISHRLLAIPPIVLSAWHMASLNAS